MNSFKLKVVLATSVAAATLFPSVGYAQATEETASETDNVIIVTARRTDENLQDVPVAITAFDSQALDRSTIQELSDVRTIAAGLNFNSEGGKKIGRASCRERV